MTDLKRALIRAACDAGVHDYSGGVCVDCAAVKPLRAEQLEAEAKRIAKQVFGRGDGETRKLVRKFLVQFEGDERTRWLASDEQIRRGLEALAKSTAHSVSGGTIPSTCVSIEP